MPQESTTRQRPGQMDTPPPAAPMPPACPPRSNRQSQQENREHPERERRRERRETGRNSEDLRPLACRIAAQVIKASNPARSQPDRNQHRRPAGTPPATVPSSSPVSVSAASILLLESLQNPPYFCPSVDAQQPHARPAEHILYPGSLHIFAPAPFLTKRSSTYTLSRTPYSIFSLGNNFDNYSTVNDSIMFRKK